MLSCKFLSNGSYLDGPRSLSDRRELTALDRVGMSALASLYWNASNEMTKHAFLQNVSVHDAPLARTRRLSALLLERVYEMSALTSASTGLHTRQSFQKILLIMQLT